MAGFVKTFEELVKLQPGIGDKNRTPEQAETAAALLRGAAVVGHSKRASSRGKMYVAGIVIGLLTSATGFTFWYLRLQRYVDAQAKADFDDHMQELAARRIERDKRAREKGQP